MAGVCLFNAFRDWLRKHDTYVSRRTKSRILRTAMILVTCVVLYLLFSGRQDLPRTNPLFEPLDWTSVTLHHPVETLKALPPSKPIAIPKIQHSFHRSETYREAYTRSSRRAEVKQVFERSWRAYKEYAWLKDELLPVSSGSTGHYGGWATTMVDSLDTLWIMNMKREFEEAVRALRQHVDFTRSDAKQISTFETTIRYLGGLLGAYDVSGHRYPDLLDMALELGEMLYHTFDTRTHMPMNWFNVNDNFRGDKQEAPLHACIAEFGSLSLEFTRLAQITGRIKFYDCVQRIADELERAQEQTKLPGMWPFFNNLRTLDFTFDTSFGLGALTDSAYEYLPKTYLLLGGHEASFERMYSKAIKTIKESVLYRPKAPGNPDLLLAGTVSIRDGSVSLEADSQHLACFAGGMLELGAQIYERPEDLAIGKRLVDGCIWAYMSTTTGIGPEGFHAMPCTSVSDCSYDKAEWEDQKDKNQGNLPEGMINVHQPSYHLRPEAIESVFYHYRISGDTTYLDKAWAMFKAIEKQSRTPVAYADISDVLSDSPQREDKMESFWLGETLKYFYLIFSEPEAYSLDDYVYNTEAHPFKRPT